MRSVTLRRYADVFLRASGLSVLRALQHEQLLALGPLGRVLDFGGGARAEYRPLLNCSAYESINIDPGIEPTWLVRPGEPLPAPQARFDTVLSMNTFEHVFDIESVLDELLLALVPRGRLITMVPFLYPVHGHPDDYVRPTPSWWRRTLTQAGFADTEVEPLFWGRGATAITAGGMSGPLQRLRLHAVLLRDVLASTIKPPPDALAMSRAVGYLITARRPDPT